MKKTGFIWLFVLFTSCVKEVPLVPSEKPYPSPVSFLFLNPDSAITLSYSRIRGITEQVKFFDSADIHILRNQSDLGKMLSVGGGVYSYGTNNFSPRDSYTVRCVYGGFDYKVSGQVPSDIVIASVDTLTQLIPGVGPSFVMNVSFTDSAVDENYYRLRLLREYFRYEVNELNIRTDSVLVKEIINISGSALPFIQNNFNKYNSRELLFSDATMNGTTPVFNIYTPDRVHQTLFQRTVAITVLLENLEKPLYDYYNTRNAHLWQQQSISQLPGLVTGNVPGGYGAVSSYTANSKRIAFPK